MGKTGAFLDTKRIQHAIRDSAQAVADFDDIVIALDAGEQRTQASRCMACGVAFCQSGIAFADSKRVTGCPLHNLIPETNDLVYRGLWKTAAKRLALTNPFPEFTGRVCPAPCEAACNLGLHDEAVTIHDNERAISDWAWEHGYERPLPAVSLNAPLVAVVGSGPAGLACAWELTRSGYRVKVLESTDRPGGLLMYGIPNMKLPKDIVMRRIDIMRKSGIEFVLGCDTQAELDALADELEAVIICIGAGKPRRVEVPGSDLRGVVFAVDYLADATRALLEGDAAALNAEGKDVVVLGGGDTGTDCVATATRQGAKSVTQIIRAQEPPKFADVQAAWPRSRIIAGQDYGQRDAEYTYGHDPRIWSTDTVGFVGEEAVRSVLVEDLAYDGGRHVVADTQRSLPAQMVIIAKGFIGPREELLEGLGANLESGLPQTMDSGHRLVANNGFAAQVPCYVAGDARTGASLVSSSIADAITCVDELIESR